MLLDSWVTNTSSVKVLCPQKYCFPVYFHKNLTCLSVNLLMICKVFSVSCKIVYQWVMTNCLFHEYYYRKGENEWGREKLHFI
jgi:hypothetical protein